MFKSVKTNYYETWKVHQYTNMKYSSKQATGQKKFQEKLKYFEMHEKRATVCQNSWGATKTMFGKKCICLKVYVKMVRFQINDLNIIP